VNEQPVAIAAAGTSMPDGRRRVLYALRRRGEATAEDLARQLSMTVSGARQHLSALVDDGLVDARERASDPPRRGRPTLAYTVTAIGDAAFPRAYGELTTDLLGFLDDEDPAVLERLWARRRDERLARTATRLATKRSLKARVTELAAILDEDGYFASVEPIDEESGGRRPSGFRIVENNCAIWAVASQFGQACSSEIEFIRSALGEGVTVDRVHHMASGDRCCAYEIRPVRRRNAPSPAR
jgi:DeoR family transcriptional regulator, suf operon transcriptional repressor